MHVVWKRPDGYHGASPEDFRVVVVGGKSRLWLHKSDTLWYPFRIAGGWQESESTQRLNSLVNLLGLGQDQWVTNLKKLFHNSPTEDAETFVKDTSRWLTDLKLHVKGDTWEVEILNVTLDELVTRINELGRSIE